MRRFFLLTVAGIVAVCAVSVGLASAGSGPKTTTEQYSTAYFDNGVQSTCVGTRIVQKDGTVKDSSTCILSGDTSLIVTGTVKGNPGYCFNGTCWAAWISDQDGQAATSVNFTVTLNLDGTFTQKITAYYPHA